MQQDGSPNRVRFGLYEADFSTQEIWKDGVRLKLARQPFEILEMLVARPGELVSREELQKRLWDEGHFIDASHGLNAAVNKLRETLCDSADEPRYIETLPRRGYRFIGQVTCDPIVEVEVATPAMVAPAEHSEPLIAPPPAVQPVRLAAAPSPMSRRWPIWVAASVALVAGGFIGASLNFGSRSAAPALSEALKKEQAEKRELATRLGAEPERARVPTGESAARVRIEPEKHPVVLPEREMHTELRPAEFRTIISGDAGNAAPQFSPDGQRIAFMSNRSGPWQIWMSNADGSDPVQVSFTDSAGTPRWAPDGKSFVFDAPWEGTTFVFLAPVNQPQNARPVAEGCVPSFSRDGKFVYFASDRTGDFEVWKVAVAGGPEIQITRHGGFAALESQDGNLYYSKSKYPNPEIWRVPVGGGEEVALSPILRPRTWASWTVTKDGVLLVADLPDGRSHLTLYDPAKGTARELTSLPTSPFWMAASADGKRVVMNDAQERQISMVENLR
jgi:DNA-binding winged helix-turn-helix (wHTH) protein